MSSTKYWLAIMFATFCLVGCNSLEVRDRWFDSDRIAEVPTEVLPIWTDTVLHQPGSPGVRGFGGRVYFYEDGKPDPVKVDGQLVVYAFDGTDRDPTMVAPLKKFVFTADQLESHYSTSSLGNSYSIWLPWDRVGGESETLSLVVRFNGRQGGTVLSKPSRMLLPGVDVRRPRGNEGKSEVQLASHEAVDELPTSRSIATASIDLPPSFQRHLSRSSSEDRGSIPAPERTRRSSTRDAERSGWEVISGPGRLPVRAAAEEVGRQTDLPVGRLGWEEVPATAATSVSDLRSQQEARYEPQRFPARRTPKVQPGRVPLRRQPHPAAWQSGLPQTPRSDLSLRSNQDSLTRVAGRQDVGSRSRPWQTQFGAEDNELGFSGAAAAVD